MKIIKTLLLAFAVISLVSCKKETPATPETTAHTATAQKIVSLNGAITEIVAALGHEKEIVGTDVTSTYPETLKGHAKDLGHVRSIAIEAIMALQPTLVLATDKDMNPALLEKLKAAGIKAHVFHQEFSLEGSHKLINDVAAILGATDKAPELTEKITIDANGTKALAKAPKVLFIYARGANMLMVSGAGTPVDKMIALAGGVNAVTGFEDYKPLTPEALIKGNPDVILMFSSGLESVGGKEGILKIPGVDKTTAGRTKSIIAMDGALLSGFGPRVGEGVSALNNLLSQNAK